MKAVLTTEKQIVDNAIYSIKNNIDTPEPRAKEVRTLCAWLTVQLEEREHPPTTVAEMMELGGQLPNGWKHLVHVPTCDACGRESYPIVTVGDEPDYESATATLCLDCCREAWELISGATP